MGVAWGDYDNDGLMDLHVSNMFSAAGNRIVDQPRFHSHADHSARQAARRFARGNSLFHNRGDGTFRDVSLPAGVTEAHWAWASRFVDIDNDTREDLIVANGFITQEDTKDL